MKARIDEFKVRQWIKKTDGIETVQDLSKAAGIGENTLYRSLKGYTWKSATLNAIASAMGCNPLDLLTVDEVAADPKPALAGLVPALA